MDYISKYEQKTNHCFRGNHRGISLRCSRQRLLKHNTKSALIKSAEGGEIDWEFEIDIVHTAIFKIKCLSMKKKC